MNDKITTNIISITGINTLKHDILPAKVFINGVEVTDTKSWNKALSTFSELQDKINNLQSKIDKAIELIHKAMIESDITGNGTLNLNELLNILKEDK